MNPISDINKRFLELWNKAKELSKLKFDKDLLNHLGYNSRAAIAKIKGGEEVSKKLINSLCDTFNFSRTYILEGKGGIYKEETVQKQNDDLETKADKLVPYYNIDIQSANIDLFTGKSKELVTKMVCVPLMDEAEAFLRVSGNSMIDCYCPGDVVGITHIDFKNGELVQFGEAYLVITKKQRMLKYVRRGQSPDIWILESHNTQKYDAIDVRVEDIVALFMVVGVVRRPIL